MITVKVERLVRTAKGLDDDLINFPIGNNIAETVADGIRKKFEGVTCPDHPKQNSVLIIRASPLGEMPTIDKSGICCAKLSDRIQITVTRKES